MRERERRMDGWTDRQTDTDKKQRKRERERESIQE